MPSIIRIKRSGIDAAPTTLKVGEFAYSYASESHKLYLGIGPEVDATGTAASIVIVGGAKYTDILSGVGGISVANAALVLGADRNTDYLKLQELVADSATVTDLTVDSAYVRFMSGDSAHIKDLTVDSAYLKFADIDNVSIDSAYIKFMDVDSAHIDNVTIDLSLIHI